MHIWIEVPDVEGAEGVLPQSRESLSSNERKPAKVPP
jgi:hypothetical protein